MGRRSTISPAICNPQLLAWGMGGNPMASTIFDTPTAVAPGAMVLEPLETEGTGSVALLEVTRIAFVSLLSNKVRSILTMLGVIIGVGSVVALLAIGSGASTAITSQIQSNGTNL